MLEDYGWLIFNKYLITINNTTDHEAKTFGNDNDLTLYYYKYKEYLVDDIRIDNIELTVTLTIRRDIK